MPLSNNRALTGKAGPESSFEASDPRYPDSPNRSFIGSRSALESRFPARTFAGNNAAIRESASPSRTASNRAAPTSSNALVTRLKLPGQLRDDLEQVADEA